MILGITHNARRPALSGGTATPARAAATALASRPLLRTQPVLRRAREPQQLCLDLQPRLR